MLRLPFRLLVWSVLLLGALFLASCDFSLEPDIATLAASVTYTASPTPPPPVVVIATQPALTAIIPADTNTPAPPTFTPTITNTPGPYEHEIQPNDTLFEIVRFYGHRHLDVYDVIVQMNPNVPNADRLPPPGQIILIPRPTATAIPSGGGPTATYIALNPPTSTPEILTAIHAVEEGQTMVGIVNTYNTTMLIMNLLNPRLDWSGCDFNVPSGGTDCNPLLTVGQELSVPAFTPTPTLSPTPSGSETPTPTPFREPVRLYAPASGVIITGGPVILSWVSAGILQSNEIYQITVFDHTANVQYVQFTRDNMLTLPPDLYPTDETAHDVTWQVVVAQVRDDNRAVVAGMLGEERHFQWVAP